MKIVEPWERPPIKQLVVMLYGLPATGKTTTAYSASKPVLIDFDRGADRARNITKSVWVDSWQDVSGITADELKQFDTVVVDTLGAAQDFLTRDIIQKNPKHGRDGGLSLQGYGALKSRFTNWLTHLKSMGKDIVLIAHTEEEKRGDDATVERIKVAGGSKDFVHQTTDAIGRLHLSNGRRLLDFEPTDSAIGKNPGRLDTLQVPPENDIGSFLGDVIAQIKGRLNADRDAAHFAARQNDDRQLEEFAKTLDGLTLEDLPEIRDAVMQDTHSVSPRIRREKAAMVKAYAAKNGWAFNSETKTYEEIAAGEEPAAEPEPTTEPEDGDDDTPAYTGELRPA